MPRNVYTRSFDLLFLRNKTAPELHPNDTDAAASPLFGPLAMCYHRAVNRWINWGNTIHTMHARRLLFTIMIVGTILLAATGCRSSGGGEEIVTVTEVADPIPASEYEARLRELVETELARQQADSGPASADLVARRPYYYREYAEFPNGASQFDLEFSERESRTTPYAAEVAYEKSRFATRLHRNREVARADTSFLRDTGRERVSYEVRNGAWRRIGSLYVADRTEELIGGEWVAVNETATRTVPEEEPQRKGWFGRTMDRLSFWN